MTSAGYNFNPPGYTAAGSGENIAWHGTTGSLPSGASGTHTIHENLFVDEDYPGRGHRVNILNPSFKEIGTGVKTGTFSVSLDTCYLDNPPPALTHVDPTSYRELDR